MGRVALTVAQQLLWFGSGLSRVPAPGALSLSQPWLLLLCPSFNPLVPLPILCCLRGGCPPSTSSSMACFSDEHFCTFPLLSLKSEKSPVSPQRLCPPFVHLSEPSVPTGACGQQGLSQELCSSLGNCSYPGLSHHLSSPILLLDV